MFRKQLPEYHQTSLGDVLIVAAKIGKLLDLPEIRPGYPGYPVIKLQNLGVLTALTSKVHLPSGKLT